MLETLTLVLTDPAHDGPALRAAVGLATRLDAHLDITCVGVEPMPMDAVGMGSAALVSEVDHGEAQRQADALAGWARSRLPSDLRTSVVAMAVPATGLTGVLAEAARFSDLAVTVRPYGPEHGPWTPVVAEAQLFGAGVPVLVVPDADRTDWRRPFRHICLAWNGSGEAMRATRAALPFLREALRVHVAVVDLPIQGPSDPTSLNALLRWLGRHGVEAEATGLARGGQRKTDLLARFAADRNCEAMVLGAFGHSRLREALLGGTTKDMLAGVPLPLILAH